jgi:hypothetical protein
MSPDELKAINDECDADDLELQEMEDEEIIAAAERAVAKKASAAPKGKPPAPTPAAAVAPKRAVRPAPPALGMGKDGVFRWTDEQMRDPAFCYATQKERAKAASTEIVK